ncbi:MAG: uridine kinase [Actinobacteria bacterium]|nr:uridine kinase [Actinomycetota bacterium]
MAEPIPTADELLALLRGVPRRQRTLLVGIDGRGGSGKTTLARELERASDDVVVVEFDDFYLPLRERQARVERGDIEIGGNFDWRRLRDQVLMPLSRDEVSSYQRYDWPSDELAEWHMVPIGGIVLIEGNYCTRHDLSSFYDYSLWIDAPHELRLERGLRRGGDHTRERWLKEWMPEEDRYIAAEDPATRVDLVLDATR